MAHLPPAPPYPSMSESPYSRLLSRPHSISYFQNPRDRERARAGMSAFTDENGGLVVNTESGGIEGGRGVDQRGGAVGVDRLKKKGGGGGKVWDDEDGSGLVNLSLRGAQVFFPFILLCIYIAIATFQKKWGVGPSFLTAFAIFMAVEGIIHGTLFLATPLMYERFTWLRGLARGLRQVRAAAIINGAQSLFMLLMAVITTVSAYTAGCKDPSKDPHADLDGYTDAMGGFCRNKRAAAAFWWFNLIAWLTTLAFVILNWRSVRRNPQSSGFVIPGSQFPADDEEVFAYQSDAEQRGPASGEVRGYRPSGDYYHGQDGEESAERGLFSKSAPGYPGGSGEDGRYRSEVNDPFDDVNAGRGHGYEQAGGEDDPYDVIRK
ncbi:hypothetical protein MNV49_003863, partial [Pseudohyphozyma bogoriensis]